MKTLFLSLLLIPALADAVESKQKESDRKPASIESELLQARLHLADVLSRGRLQDQICELGAYQSDIMKILAEARYTAGFRPSMVNDNMRRALKGTIFIQEITGAVDLDTKEWTVAEFTKALTGAYFEGPGMGVYGPRRWMTMQANGVLEFTNRQVLDDEPWVRDVPSKGTWGVQVKKEGYRVVARVWFKVGNKTETYRLERDDDNTGWVLRVKRGKSGEESWRNRFYNGEHSNCEA